MLQALDKEKSEFLAEFEQWTGTLSTESWGEGEGGGSLFAHNEQGHFLAAWWFDGYWFKRKGMVHLVWIGGTGSLKSILSSLILKVYHAFVFKPMSVKFGKFTNIWMLFQMTCPIFNLIDIKYS